MEMVENRFKEMVFLSCVIFPSFFPSFPLFPLWSSCSLCAWCPCFESYFFNFIFTFLPVCIRMLPLRMLPVCTRLGLVCYPYICVRIRMSSVCTRMYSYVTRMYSCGVLVTISFKLVLIFSHRLHYLTQRYFSLY